MEKDAVEWAWPLEIRDTMFSVVNVYTRKSQFQGLRAELSYRLQIIVENIVAIFK